MEFGDKNRLQVCGLYSPELEWSKKAPLKMENLSEIFN